MLVVDLHTLHAVDVLDFVDDVLLNGCRSHDVEDVSGGDGAVGEGHARADDVVLLHEELLGKGHEIFLDLSELGCDGDFAVASLNLAEADLAVDFGDDCGVGGVAGLEELGDTGETAGDVAGASGCASNLDEGVADGKVLAFAEDEVGAHGEGICGLYVALGVDDVDFGDVSTVAGLDDHAVLGLVLLAGVDAVCDVLDEAAVVNLTGVLGYDNGVEGVPFADYVVLVDFGAVADEEL